MFEAFCLSTSSVYSASDFGSLGARERAQLRPHLICLACRADAYFVREARNGRSACFGARPHADDCELASLATESGGSAALDETDERINAGDVFRLEPNQIRTVRHVTHDPNREPGAGSAGRYTGIGQGSVRTSSLTMDRLLRQLVTRPYFQKSRTKLILDDGTQGTVRSVCVNVLDATEKQVGRKKVYWGTFRFPEPTDTGGSWLNTGTRDTPTVVASPELLVTLLESKALEDMEDLSGAAFVFLGKLRQGPSGKLLLFPADLEWFGVRLFDEDLEVN